MVTLARVKISPSLTLVRTEIQNTHSAMEDRTEQTTKRTTYRVLVSHQSLTNNANNSVFPLLPWITVINPYNKMSNVLFPTLVEID